MPSVGALSKCSDFCVPHVLNFDVVRVVCIGGSSEFYADSEVAWFPKFVSAHLGVANLLPGKTLPDVNGSEGGGRNCHRGAAA